MSKSVSFLFIVLALITSGCGPSIYKSTTFNDAASRHHIVAILPAAVTMQLRPGEARRTSPEQIDKTQEQTGYAIQERLYGWFLRRSDRYKYTVRFQEVSETNDILRRAGITYKAATLMSKRELAQLLNVDAVISTSVITDKPMSTGAAVALGIGLGVWGPTNTATTDININDGASGERIWNYEYRASGSVGSSPESLVNALMRNASKKFPYNSR